MGIGFAIPINMANAIKDQLVTSGKVTRGFLGVLIQDMTQDLAQSFGLDEASGILIADVTNNSPAEKAGLEQGDVIIALNGRPTKSVGDFRNEIASNAPGTTVSLTLLRGGDERTIDVTTGEMPDETVASASSEQVTEQLGLTVQDLTPETARSLGVDVDEGALVADVEQGSIAWDAGIQPGNLITSVNRRRVDSAEAFLKEVRQAESSDPLLLRVKDRGFSRYIALRLP
jgi:serine protease Do